MHFISTVITGKEKREDVSWLNKRFCQWLASTLEHWEPEGKIDTILYQPICLPKKFSHFEEYFAVRERGTLLHLSPKIDHDAFDLEDRKAAASQLLRGLVEGVEKFLARGRYKRPLTAILFELQQVDIDEFVAAVAGKKMDLPEAKSEDPLTAAKVESLLANPPETLSKRDIKMFERLLVRLKEREAGEG